MLYQLIVHAYILYNLITRDSCVQENYFREVSTILERIGRRNTMRRMVEGSLVVLSLLVPRINAVVSLEQPAVKNEKLGSRPNPRSVLSMTMAKF